METAPNGHARTLFLTLRPRREVSSSQVIEGRKEEEWMEWDFVVLPFQRKLANIPRRNEREIGPVEK